LVPAFGLTPIQNLTAEAIERWQAELLAAGTPGPRSVEICRTVLGTMLKDARKKGRLFVNPVENVRRFDVPKRELHYLNAAQVKDLCEKVGRVYGVLFLVMAFCGLRIGEVLGLEWPDLDLSRRRLFVQRQAVWLRKRQCPDGHAPWRLVEPKSKAGVRVVEIPAPLVPFLAAHRAAQNGGPNPHALVFPSEAGTPLQPGNVRRRVFKPALAALGLTGIRPHDFRRTFVALHVEAGTHPKLVQERIGHSNITTTMNVYGALAGKMQLNEEQTARLDNMATATAETLVNTWSTGPSATPHDTPRQPVTPKALSA
jgi:integrase